MIYNYQIAVKNNELILDRFIFNNHRIQTLAFNDFLELAKELRDDVYNKHRIKDKYCVNSFGFKEEVISMIDVKTESFLKKLNKIKEIKETIDKCAAANFNSNCYIVIDVSIKGWKSFMSIEQFLKRTYYIDILEKFKSESSINLSLNSKFLQCKNPKLFSCHDIINCILDNWYYLLDNGRMHRTIYLKLLMLKYFRLI